MDAAKSYLVRNATTLICTGFSFVLGVIGLLLSYWYPWHGIIEHLGEAFIVAAVLTVTVHIWLSRELISDTFKASIGYVLPPELRGELSSIIDCRFICEDSLLEVTLRKEPYGQTDQIRVGVQATRTLKNITNKTEKLHAGVGVERWGLPGDDSIVRECTISTSKPPQSESFKVRKCPCRFDANTKLIDIQAGKTCDIFYKYEETRRTNDCIYWTFFHPTVNPKVRILFDRSVYDLDVEFVSKGRIQPNEHQDHSDYNFEGTFLGHHFVKIRWWPKGFNAKEHGGGGGESIGTGGLTG